MRILTPTKCGGEFRLTLKGLLAEGGMQGPFSLNMAEDSSIDESSLLIFAVSISLKT
jgi:hypothetical protein